MEKKDKLPRLDPSVRGIFSRIIETVAQLRKQQRSPEYVELAKRRELDRQALLRLRDREAKASESEKIAREILRMGRS